MRPLASGARGAFHWSEGYLGVSLQERQDTMQVMLGSRDVTAGKRWDATLVIIIELEDAIISTSSKCRSPWINPYKPYSVI